MRRQQTGNKIHTKLYNQIKNQKTKRKKNQETHMKAKGKWNEEEKT